MTQAEPGEPAEAQERPVAAEQGDAPTVDGADLDGSAVSEEPEPADAATLEATVEELRAQYARAVADYQNLKRRQAEERREYTRLAQKTLVLNYLPVFDDLSRALDSVGDHEELDGHSWVDGVRMVQRKFLAVLEGSGVERIDAEGKAFDPELHEAVAFQAGPDGRVVAVVQNGYTIAGLVIRPAMVLVGTGEGGEATAREATDRASTDREATDREATDRASNGESENGSSAASEGEQDEAGTRDSGEG
ncbi:MAG: nucleotide exchange factor GrpE [Dehalococcoidia bacterium]